MKSLKQDGKPFFYALGFIKPHLPFCAPEKYWAMHDRDKLWPPSNRKLPPGTPGWVSQTGWELRAMYKVSEGNAPLGDELEKHLRHGYYAATAYVDAQIGKVLDALKAEGLDKNTVVVLWGDHGMWCKHTNFEEAVRAPLVISAPGFSKPEKIHTPVEFLDVFPTLAALCNLPAPTHLEGQNLTPLLKDPESKTTRSYAFSQYPRGTGANGRMGYSVRKGPWRYTEWIRNGSGKVEHRELYNLETDPTVTKNFAAEEPAVVGELTAILSEAGQGVVKARAK